MNSLASILQQIQQYGPTAVNSAFGGNQTGTPVIGGWSPPQGQYNPSTDYNLYGQTASPVSWMPSAFSMARNTRLNGPSQPQPQGGGAETSTSSDAADAGRVGR